jgi:MraZ protein
MKSGSRSKNQHKQNGEARFRGRFEVKLDPKGRLSLPPSLRLSNQLVITNQRLAGRNALHIYTLATWETLEARIQKLSPLDAAVQAFERFYISGGQVTELDGQGRLLLPSSLRRFAQIETDAVLVGLGDKLEVWSQPLWETLFGEMTADFDATQAAVAKIESKNEDES